MKLADIVPGNVYECLVSGKPSPVLIVREVSAHVHMYARNSVTPSHATRRARKFQGLNLRTGALLPKLITAQRCRKFLKPHIHCLSTAPREQPKRFEIRCDVASYWNLSERSWQKQNVNHITSPLIYRLSQAEQAAIFKTRGWIINPNRKEEIS